MRMFIIGDSEEVINCAAVRVAAVCCVKQHRHLVLLVDVKVHQLCTNHSQQLHARTLQMLFSFYMTFVVHDD